MNRSSCQAYNPVTAQQNSIFIILLIIQMLGRLLKNQRKMFTIST